VHEIRKYKFYEVACSDVLFVVHRYHYKFVGLAGSGIDSATMMALETQLPQARWGAWRVGSSVPLTPKGTAVHYYFIPISIERPNRPPKFQWL